MNSKAITILFLVSTLFFCITEASDTAFSLSLVSRIASTRQAFDNDTAEIPAYDVSTQYLFVANSGLHCVDYFNLKNVSRPTYEGYIDLSTEGDLCASVAVHESVLAAVISSYDVVSNGKIFLIDVSVFPPVILQTHNVGALPDSVLFTPDGKKILVANEGEPNSDYSIDPEGTVSVIQLIVNGKEQEFSVDAVKKTTATVTSLNFHSFDKNLNEYQKAGSSIRIFGPGSSVSQDLEPEYFAISEDSKDAWVMLQENNAIAHIDLDKLEITDIFGLGYKDANKGSNSFDGNNEGVINIANWPVSLMYQPDEAEFISIGGNDYIIMANEGDKRDYFDDEANYNEVSVVSDLILDPTAFPNAKQIQNDTNIGPLKVSNTASYADVDGDGDVDVLYSFGARSFTIYDVNKNRIVFDSANEIEKFLSTNTSANFNSKDTENQSFDERSIVSGAEPEGVAIGEIDGIIYFFITLDKQGGVLMYELEDPEKPEFKGYINHRNFDVVFDETNYQQAQDLGPEGLVFVSEKDTVDGNPLLILSNTVSGNISIFRIKKTAGFNESSNSRSGASSTSRTSRNSSNDSSNASFIAPSLLIIAIIFAIL